MPDVRLAGHIAASGQSLDYCDHFLAHEQERALEQEAENEPEPEQVTELSPQSQAFMMDL